MTTAVTQAPTKERALKVLLQTLEQARIEVSDDSAKTLLTDQLLIQIFDVAWQHQFDEDRIETMRQFREIVQIAVGLM